MTQIEVRKGNGGTVAVPPRPRTWEPFRMMRELLRFDPFVPFAEMMPSGIEELGYTPEFDLKETKDAFVLKGDLPGVEEKDLEVKITANRLTIGGKRESEKTEKGETFYTYERSYGSFLRNFTLPEGVDIEHIQAELKQGVLTVKIPKKPELQPKKISVKSS